MDDQLGIFIIAAVFIIILCLIGIWKSLRGHEARRSSPLPTVLPSQRSSALPPHRGASATAAGESPKTGLNPSAMAALPTFAYRKTTAAPGEEGADRAACAVCLGAVEEGEMVRMLPGCLHMLHRECVDMWLRTNSTCPVCRAEAEPAKVAEMVMGLGQR